MSFHPERLPYYLSAFIKFRLHIPTVLLAGIPLTDKCNLKCAHCVVANQGRGHNSYRQILSWMDELYAQGARILYFQGGEIFTWKEKGRDHNDIIRAAREKGFFRISIVTNGTLPINTIADHVWISLDGGRTEVDRIRGRGTFNKILYNIEQTSHSAVYANLTINRLNKNAVIKTVNFVSDHPKLKGISINFHVPYPGVSDLSITHEERSSIIRTLIKMKREGHRILNSYSGLTALANRKYLRPSPLIKLVEMGKLNKCCWACGDKIVCDGCGYGIIAEMDQIMRLKPDAVINSLRLF